jgi:ABC-2 type transport system permease protein
MRKYWVVFTSNLQRAFASRLKICTWGFVAAVTPIIMICVFTQYYRSGHAVPGYTFEEMLAYYLSVVFISVWISGVAAQVTPDIREGNLSNFIIKPMDYIYYRIPWEIGWYVISMIFAGLPLIFLIAIGNSDTVILILKLFSNNIFLFIPSLIMSYLISFFLSMIVGLLAFFITETNGLENLLEAVTELFSGKIVPLTFFPSTILTFIRFLPFGYIVYFPSQILTGKVSENNLVSGFFIQFTWVVILYLVTKLVWKLGVKKFSAVGL